LVNFMIMIIDKCIFFLFLPLPDVLDDIRVHIAVIISYLVLSLYWQWYRMKKVSKYLVWIL